MRSIFYHSDRQSQINKILPEEWEFALIPSFGGAGMRLANLVKIFREVRTGNYRYILVDSTWVPLWVCVILKKMFNIKIILRLRGDPFIQYEDTGMFLSLRIDKFALKQVDIFITVSLFLKNELIRYGIESNKIYELNTAIEPPDRDRDYQAKKEINFLFVTDFHFKRKVMGIPEAINEIGKIIDRHNWKVKILIAGQGRHLTMVRDLVRRKMERYRRIYGLLQEYLRLLQKE